MPRFLGLALVALIATLLLAWPAGHALASHVACGDVITQDTRLDSDLWNCPGDGIVIGAKGVTLDLNGHIVDGDGDARGSRGCDTGIVNSRLDACSGYPAEPGHSNVTIKDGVLRQFAIGVQAVSADGNAMLRLQVYESTGFAGIGALELSNSRLEGNRILDSRGPSTTGIGVYEPAGENTITGNVIGRNPYFGIELTGGSDGTRLTGNTIFENASDGIRMGGSTGVLVMGNRVFANGSEGIDASDGVFENVIAGNRVWDNGLAGILLGEGAHRNRVDRNLVSHNVLTPSSAAWYPPGGIALIQGRDNEVSRNRVVDNGGLGGVVLADQTMRNLIRTNDVASNAGDGILLLGPLDEDNVITANRAIRNGEDGIHVAPDFVDPEAPPRNVLVRRNRANRNGDDGIDVESAQTTLGDNSARKNLDLGIEAVTGVFDDGGNLGRRNGNPLQCLNVACR